MKRRFSLNLIVSSLVIVTTLSLMIAPVAVGCGEGYPNTVLSKLRELRSEIYDLPDNTFKNPCLAQISRRVVASKLRVVICMVEAGAYQGAIKKLEKDVKKTVEHWLTEEYAHELIQKINEIIELLKKLKPPQNPSGPDFAIMAFPESLTVGQGSSNSSTILIISLKGFNKPVNLTAVTSPLTPEIVLALNPPTVNPPKNEYTSSTLTVEAAQNATVSTYTITVTGASQSLQHSTEIFLEIVPAPLHPPVFDFDISTYPILLNVQQGSSNTSILTVASLTDASQSVDLAVTSEPISGVDATLYPLQVIPPPNGLAISILTVEANTTAPLGYHNVMVTGTSDALKRSVTIILNVTALTVPPIPSKPDFLIAAFPPSITIEPGDSDALTIVVFSVREFNQSVNLSVASEPSGGVTLSLSPSELTPPINGFASSALTVSVDAAAEPGKYDINVSGTSGNLKHEIKVGLEVVVEDLPPQIVSVLRQPETPSYNESVSVLAFVIDVGSGVGHVFLSYSGDAAWTNVTMSLTDGLYNASIPAFPYSTVVEYRVYARDRAENWATPSSVDSYIVADFYAPEIEVPSWAPLEPAANVEVIVNVTVSEPSGASGVREVTLWFRNKTLDNWMVVPMTFDGVNWTVGLKDQSDTQVDFKIEASDRAGNWAETQPYQFRVRAHEGFPLALILLIISILAALTGSTAYLLFRRRQRERGTGPVSAVSFVEPPSPPSVHLSAPLTEARERGYGMVSFVVPARNEEGTISQRIARAYECAVSHGGAAEIIVVDDGSVDNTFDIAWLAVESNRSKWPNIPVKLLKLTSPMGRQEAIQVGRNKATGEFVETINDETYTVSSMPILA